MSKFHLPDDAFPSNSQDTAGNITSIILSLHEGPGLESLDDLYYDDDIELAANDRDEVETQLRDNGILAAGFDSTGCSHWVNQDATATVANYTADLKLWLLDGIHEHRNAVGRPTQYAYSNKDQLRPHHGVGDSGSGSETIGPGQSSHSNQASVLLNSGGFPKRLETELPLVTSIQTSSLPFPATKTPESGPPVPRGARSHPYHKGKKPRRNSLELEDVLEEGARINSIDMDIDQPHRKTNLSSRRRSQDHSSTGASSSRIATLLRVRAAERGVGSASLRPSSSSNQNKRVSVRFREQSNDLNNAVESVYRNSSLIQNARAVDFNPAESIPSPRPIPTRNTNGLTTQLDHQPSRPTIGKDYDPLQHVPMELDNQSSSSRSLSRSGLSERQHGHLNRNSLTSISTPNPPSQFQSSINRPNQGVHLPPPRTSSATSSNSARGSQAQSLSRHGRAESSPLNRAVEELSARHQSSSPRSRPSTSHPSFESHCSRGNHYAKVPRGSRLRNPRGSRLRQALQMREESAGPESDDQRPTTTPNARHGNTPSTSTKHSTTHKNRRNSTPSNSASDSGSNSDKDNAPHPDPDSSSDSSSDSDSGISEGQNQERHKGVALDKAAGVRQSAPLHTEQISIAIADYAKLLLGIARKTQGTKRSNLPHPPTADEISSWEQRKKDRRGFIERRIEKALNKYLDKTPNPKKSQLALIEAEATKLATEKLKPTPFLSQLDSFSPSSKYSTSVAASCEAALALAGFPRCTFIWTHTLKCKWNEAMYIIILQEWEKCYRRGDADDYHINVNHVTSDKMRLIFEQWYDNKRTAINSGLKKEAKALENPNAEQEELEKDLLVKQRNARRRSRRTVAAIRKEVMTTHFPQQANLILLTSQLECHSKDDLDEHGNQYRTLPSWRLDDLSTLFHTMDKFYISSQLSALSKSVAIKRLSRGPHKNIDDSQMPPVGFPRCLVSDIFWQGLLKSEKLALDLSHETYDLREIIAKFKDLQT
ncbi:uncharacterized protein MELLADRAFT_85863 [Melampsora larici-populina 98AG31]|uniref:Uncharacterized protein n=1 Tax=Melampsora larici-populina (strain 98AG31 / pathotype 3-4-7) TaxID=747676 RepID=F4SDE8_MELLP|nr:uncharacterized protein MELLADRAFT_85863 [Melampsora larici-populina 98AG31]EGF97329.1 hypothetical protein MELLADRAFT_85863 [Melampsora larici-populina 98AG31]